MSAGKRAGRGSHGALTKAGRVRSTTPKVEKTSKRRSKIPRREKRCRLRRVLFQNAKRRFP